MGIRSTTGRIIYNLSWVIVSFIIITFAIINGDEKIVDIEKHEIRTDTTKVETIEIVKVDQFQKTLDQINDMDSKYNGKIRQLEDEINQLRSRIESLESQ